VCCSLLWPLGAAAQPTLAWQAPAECPTPSQARAELSHLLRKKLSDIDVELALLVRIKGSSAAGFEASVVTRGGASSRERVLRDPRCDVLTHAVAVVCALAIDPAANLPEHEGAGASSTPTDAAQPGRDAQALAMQGSPMPPLAADATASATFGAAAGATSSAASAATTGAATATASRAANAATAGAATHSATAGAATHSASAATPGASARAANLATTAAIPHRATAEAASQGASDAGAAAAQEPAEAAPESAAEAPGEAAAHATEPEPTQQRATQLAVVLSAGGGALAGVLPQLAPEVSAAVSVLGERWRASLRLAYAAAQHAVLDDPPGVGGRVSLASAAVDGGLRWHGRRVEIPLLLGLETGFFVADGEGVDSHSQSIAAWLASYLGSGVSVALGPNLAVGLRAEGLVAWLRPRFAVVDTSTGHSYEFHRPAALGGRAFLELEVRLP
jgi:hypothetical protein